MIFTEGIDANLLVVLYAGAAAPAIGLMALWLYRLGEPRLAKRLPLAAAVGLTLWALVTSGAGQSPAVWLPPLALAAICAALYARYSPWLARLGARFVAIGRHPVVHASVLMAAGPLLALGWTRTGAPPELPLSPDALAYALQPAPTSPFCTDRGQPVEIMVFPAAMQAKLALWEKETPLRNFDNVPDRVFPLTPRDCRSNCHGWVFAEGKHLLRGRTVELILNDNGYQPVVTPQRGDLAVYRAANGDILHTGIVHAVCVDGEVQIQSKWGCEGLYLHPADTTIYPATVHYYRSDRSGHRLRRVADAPPAKPHRKTKPTPVAPPSAPPLT